MAIASATTLLLNHVIPGRHNGVALVEAIAIVGGIYAIYYRRKIA